MTETKDRVAKVPGFAELAEWLNQGLAGDTLITRQSPRPPLLLGAERPLVLYGPSMVSGLNAEANRTALMNFALLAGCADRTYYLAPEANSVGVRDMGLLPNRLPGHAAIGDAAARERLERLWGGKLPMDPGLSYEAMLDAASSGRLKALLLVASDPASEGPAARVALEKAEFVVVQDLFLSESAKLADVVLPAVSWAETDGTFTNLERRIQRAPKALANPHSQAASDWSILFISHSGGQAWRPTGRRGQGKERQEEGESPSRGPMAQPRRFLTRSVAPCRYTIRLRGSLWATKACNGHGKHPAPTAAGR